MLPELHTLQKVFIKDSNYWRICFDKDNWILLENILKTSGCIDIKQRAGCLSYLEDPNRLKSMLTQTLTRDKYNSWKVDAKNLLAFSSDHKITTLANKFLLPIKKMSTEFNEETTDTKEIVQMLILHTYNCLTHDKMHGLSICMNLINLARNFEKLTSSIDLWQFKILQAILDRHKPILESDVLISPDILQSLSNRVKTKMDQMLIENRHILEKFIVAGDGSLQDFSEFCADSLGKLAKLVMFFDLPFRLIDANMLEHIKQLDFVQLLYGSREYQLETRVIYTISNILNI